MELKRRISVLFKRNIELGLLPHQRSLPKLLSRLLAVAAEWLCPDIGPP